MPSAIVIGSAGQLGHELTREFAQRNWTVRGLDRGDLDISNDRAVEHALAAASPDVVLNAAAYNQVDIAESEPLAAYQVNGLAVRNLALACRQCDARLVHFSTDYVFDGTAGRPYKETDPPRPLSAYGVSKLAGEFYARAYLDRALIVRTCGVFGPAGRRTARGNFVELMLRLATEQARTRQPIRVVEDHVASPTYAPELARVTADLVERQAAGVVHAGGGEALSWFAWAKTIFRLAGLDPEVRATNEREYRTAAKRPAYSALENARLRELEIAPMESLEECLARYLERRV